MISCPDPEGGTGGRDPSPFENHKAISFLSNNSPDPLETQSYEGSIQCLVIIDPPEKHHF